MLELMLLRHAKSDWDASYGTDRERPLNGRGVRSARAVGRYLSQVDRVPDIALTSPAVRARTTVELAAEAGSWPTPIEVVDDLYGGGPDAVLAAARRATDATRVMIAGHEPTMSTTLSRLIGGGSVRVPTAALAEFQFAYPRWGEVAWGSGELVAFTRSRSLLALGYGD